MKGGVKVKQLDRSVSVGQGLTKNTSFLEMSNLDVEVCFGALPLVLRIVYEIIE